MTRAQIETAVRAWLVAVTGLDSAKVIPADDHGERPGKPYLTYRVGTRTPEGGADSQIAEVEDDDVIVTFRGEKRLRVGIQAYGNGAFDLLCTAEGSLEDLDATADLVSAGLNFSVSQGVQTVPQVLPGANKWEERAALDLEFLLFARRTANQGGIDRVESTAFDEPLNIDL